jgi:hypothetical protein
MFGNAFGRAVAFKSDLSGWNVASVKDMNAMFAKAPAFNSDLSGWNVARVRVMDEMFSFAKAFDRNIAGWNVLSVTTFLGAPPRLRPLASLLHSHAAESVRLVCLKTGDIDAATPIKWTLSPSSTDADWLSFSPSSGSVFSSLLSR